VIDAKYRILVICTGNSVRSQMAEGSFRQLGGERVEVLSAGSEPSDRVHPLAVRAMAEIGIDISHQRPRSLSAFVGEPFDIVIAVCSRAARSCPAFPAAAKRLNWFYDDPAAVAGTETERLAAFRAVRDDLHQRIVALLASLVTTPQPVCHDSPHGPVLQSE
jgi:arsenate reductase